ncbi:hypothetical protein [Devosia sp. 1566]|uniref:outer membrane protein n=1 Tax=Devosia sp. 1566 TaxID=2499144 RepID=UPI000FD8D0E9|nr:hypothetical protein [Devosia sp. 1566]
MNPKTLALLACISLAAVPTVAQGAEAFAQLDVPALPTEYEVAVDWSGFYAGVLGQAVVSPDSTGGIAAALGYSWAAGELILSGEAGIARFGDGSVDLFALARAGFLPSETLMIFALADLGTNSDTDAFAGLGAGAELALSANFSLRGQYEYRTDLSSDDASHLAAFGFAYRF